MTNPDSLSSVDDRYDGSLLTDTPQYFFVTDFVSQEMLETFLQNISQLCGFNVPDSTPHRIESTPDDSLYNSLLQAKAEGSCQQFFSLSKRVLCRRAILLGDNDIACNF